MECLHKVIFSFDKTNKQYFDNFIMLLENVIEAETLMKSNVAFMPTVVMNSTSDEAGVLVQFIGDNINENIHILNETGKEKTSYEKYKPIDLGDLKKRFQQNSIVITRIDHIGFNLPWFESGLHPRIKELRDKLSSKSLYHTFPSGEPWDFILPGTQEEISGLSPINYEIIRKPKIEIVSFEKCSTPIIQFDVCCSCKMEMIKELFSEGLYDHNLNNI